MKIDLTTAELLWLYNKTLADKWQSVVAQNLFDKVTPALERSKEADELRARIADLENS